MLYLIFVRLSGLATKIVPSGVQMPRMHSVMERWVQTCRHEILDRTLIWNQRQLLRSLREFECGTTPAPGNWISSRPRYGCEPGRPAPSARHVWVTKTGAAAPFGIKDFMPNGAERVPRYLSLRGRAAAEPGRLSFRRRGGAAAGSRPAGPRRPRRRVPRGPPRD